MPVRTAEEIVAEAQRTGTLVGVRISVVDEEAEHDPWTLPPSQERAGASHRRTVAETGPDGTRKPSLCGEAGPALRDAQPTAPLAAFQNPEFYKAQAMRLSTYAKPRVIACGEDLAHHIAVPRGCLAETLALLEAHHIRPEVRDERFGGHAMQR